MKHGSHFPINCRRTVSSSALAIQTGVQGENYIFCAPQAGRIAITDRNFSNEQNAYGNFDFSFHTNFHVTAVFNPPLDYIALYTNGVLAAINGSVTTPFTSVDDIYSYIGRSLYDTDPYPDFMPHEFPHLLQRRSFRKCRNHRRANARPGSIIQRRKSHDERHHLR